MNEYTDISAHGSVRISFDMTGVGYFLYFNLIFFSFFLFVFLDDRKSKRYRLSANLFLMNIIFNRLIFLYLKIIRE